MKQCIERLNEADLSAQEFKTLLETLHLRLGKVVRAAAANFASYCDDKTQEDWQARAKKEVARILRGVPPSNYVQWYFATRLSGQFVYGEQDRAYALA